MFIVLEAHVLTNLHKPGVNSNTRQTGHRNTFIANNGLERLLAHVKNVNLTSSQKGNDNYNSTSNAVVGNEVEQMKLHKEQSESVYEYQKQMKEGSYVGQKPYRR